MRAIILLVAKFVAAKFVSNPHTSPRPILTLTPVKIKKLIFAKAIIMTKLQCRNCFSKPMHPMLTFLAQIFLLDRHPIII